MCGSVRGLSSGISVRLCFLICYYQVYMYSLLYAAGLLAEIIKVALHLFILCIYVLETKVTKVW